MLPITARTVYIDPEVAKRPNCQHRLERILPHIHCDDIREYDEQALKEINSVGSRRHGKDDFGDDAILAFTTFDEKRRGW
ncbi:MAG: hypothetical protein HOC74_01405, partial [Gemmatimonadetes bacterium]|nr:hypothetical protein [Gemmatimonadota bacterium]